MKNTGYSGLSLHGHGDFLLTVSEFTPVGCDLVTPQDPTESTILQHGHHHLAWADQKLVVWFATPQEPTEATLLEPRHHHPQLLHLVVWFATPQEPTEATLLEPRHHHPQLLHLVVGLVVALSYTQLHLPRVVPGHVRAHVLHHSLVPTQRAALKMIEL